MLRPKKVLLEKQIRYPIKVAFFSNGPNLPTGYAKVIREIIRRLKNDTRFQPLIFNENIFVNLQGEYEGVPMFGVPHQQGMGPNGTMMQGFTELCKNLTPDVVVILEDSFTLHNYGFDNIVQLPAKRVFYIPLDGGWIPSTGVTVVRTMDKLVAMAKFTQDELKKEGFDSDMIWHGVDLDLFHPVSDEKQKELKKKYGFDENDFVIFNYGRNSNVRKNNQGMIRTLATYLKNAPANHKAFLHIMERDREDNNLVEYIDRHMKHELGEDAGNKIFWSKHDNYDKAATDQEVAEMVQMSDLVLTASTGEGFGLIMAEGMACGKPVISTDYTTPNELLMDTSLGISERGWVVPFATTNVSMLNTEHAYVDIKKYVETLQEITKNPEELKKRGRNGRVFAEKYLNWDYLVEQWKKVIIDIV